MHSALLAVVLLVACEPGYDPCFDPPSVVQDWQAIAVRADPPELTEPQDVAFVQLSVLLANPGTIPRAVSVEARLCPLKSEHACPDEATVATVSTDSEHVAITIAVPRALVDAARAADLLAGYDGTRVVADLRMQSDAFSLRASKLLLFRPPGAPLNGAVNLDGMEVTGPGRTPMTFVANDTLFTLVPDGTVPVAFREGTLELRPLLHPGSVEEYDVVDLWPPRAPARADLVRVLREPASLLRRPARHRGQRRVLRLGPADRRRARRRAAARRALASARARAPSRAREAAGGARMDRRARRARRRRVAHLEHRRARYALLLHAARRPVLLPAAAAEPARSHRLPRSDRAGLHTGAAARRAVAPVKT